MLMLGVASLFTLGIIFGFIFVIVMLVAYYGGFMDMSIIITLTVVINFVAWLVSPYFMELMFKWIYKTQQLTIEDLEKKSKRVGEFVRRLCEKHKMKIPRIGYILDDNPTAFSFGSGIYNARLYFSEGLFTYLDEDEIEAVLAHELGHIRRRDFIIMTIAATAVQILYELAQVLLRVRSSNSKDKKSAFFWIGILSYILYFISVYLLLFLSRVREYGADAFCAHEVDNPDALSRALVKIAYGIVAKPDDAAQQKLMSSTRALGPFDPQSARQLGTAFQTSKQDWSVITQVLAFDLISPWAKISQLQSTHPLTGLRIKKLNEFAKQKGKKITIDTEAAKNVAVDKGKLYKGFALGAFIYFLPWLAPLAVFGATVAMENVWFISFLPASIGVSILIKIWYKYPQSRPPEKATTLAMMSDLYASPVRGRFYSMTGNIIGRGDAGAKFGEDMMLQDEKGLIYLNYESAFSWVGNLIFAWSKVRALIGKHIETTGWFFRDITHHFDIKNLTADQKVIKSYPRLWAVIGALITIALSAWISSQIYGMQI